MNRNQRLQDLYNKLNAVENKYDSIKAEIADLEDKQDANTAFLIAEYEKESSEFVKCSVSSERIDHFVIKDYVLNVITCGLYVQDKDKAIFIEYLIKNKPIGVRYIRFNYQIIFPQKNLQNNETI